MIRHIVTDKRTGEVVSDCESGVDAMNTACSATAMDILDGEVYSLTMYDTDTHEVRDGRVVARVTPGQTFTFDRSAFVPPWIRTPSGRTDIAPDPRDERIRVLEEVLQWIHDSARAVVTESGREDGPPYDHDTEGSVGYYKCCHRPDYKPHSDDCWWLLRTDKMAILSDATTSASTVLSRKGG